MTRGIRPSWEMIPAISTVTGVVYIDMAGGHKENICNINQPVPDSSEAKPTPIES